MKKLLLISLLLVSFGINAEESKGSIEFTLDNFTVDPVGSENSESGSLLNVEYSGGGDVYLVIGGGIGETHDETNRMTSQTYQYKIGVGFDL